MPNSSNTISKPITKERTEEHAELLEQCKTLITRTQLAIAAVIKALNKMRIESGKQAGNKIERKDRTYGLKNMEKL